jgi:hypothetical protein
MALLWDLFHSRRTSSEQKLAEIFRLANISLSQRGWAFGPESGQLILFERGFPRDYPLQTFSFQAFYRGHTNDLPSVCKTQCGKFIFNLVLDVSTFLWLIVMEPPVLFPLYS